MKIDQNTIEEIKDKLDIVEVISDHVVLKRSGRGLVGLCPFHQENTPSFSVSEEKQCYYCFGCGAGGGAIKFLMELNKQSFRDVMLDLADRYSVPIQQLTPEKEKEYKQQKTEKQILTEILSKALFFYKTSLRENRAALDYLLHKRKLTDSTIEHFNLGYAPDTWDKLYNFLVVRHKHSPQLVVKAGLIKPRDGKQGYYDLFRKRIIIPIYNEKGNLVGFGSRSLDNQLPKYLNSPESKLFNKSKTLFALNHADKAIRAADEVIIVEGYFDAIALHQSGILNTVACLGTAITQAHVKMLSKYTEEKKITLNLDGDKAGVKAVERTIDLINPLIMAGQVQLKVLNLPSGKDADEFILADTKNIEQYKKLSNNAPLWIDWKLKQIIGDTTFKTASNIVDLIKSIKTVLNPITNADLKSHYMIKAAELLSGGDSQQFRLIQESFTTGKTPQSSLKKQYKLPVKPELTPIERAEQQVLRIYINNLDYRSKIEEGIISKDLSFQTKNNQTIWQALLSIDKNYSSTQIINEFDNQEIDFTSIDLLENPVQNSERDKQVIETCLIQMKLFDYEERKAEYQFQFQDSQDEETYAYYYQEYFKLKKKIMELNTQLKSQSSHVL